ncbi:MAG: copper resistance protein CopC [Microbacterium sp.]
MSSQGVHTVRRSRFRRAAIAALVAALALVASPAWAHDELIGSDPAAGSHLDELPAELTLTFSDVLLDEPGTTEVVVTDAAGTSLTSGDPVLDGTRLTQALEGEASGTVTVIWRVVSHDGHPVSDEFSFTVGEDTASTPTATLIDEDPLTVATDITWILWASGAVVVAGGILLTVVLARKRHPRED